MKPIPTVHSHLPEDPNEGESMRPGGFMLSISRPTRSLDAKATLPPKASAPQAGGTAEDSSSSGAVSGIKPKEAKLAGYLLARAAMNQKVEGPVLKNLRAGHESVQQVNELLPLGRANVIQDIEKAKGEHLPLRKDAANKLVNDLLFNHLRYGRDLTDDDINGTIAASAQYAKTGTCGCFASITTSLHAAKLADMEDKRAVVSHTAHTTIDHGWSEMLPKGNNADGTPILHGKDVIMDGWCKEKLAILREDSHFARLDTDGKAGHLKHDDPLNHVTGPEALKTTEKYKAQIENSPYFQDSFKKEFNCLVDAKEEWPKESFWNDTSVFHADFRGQAAKALHQDATKPSPIPDVDRVWEQAKRASIADIQAVGVARSLGSNVRGAIAEAPGIIASAKEMFPHSVSEGN
jgi:hypothetical protein